MNLDSAHSHLNLQFESQQEADDYIAEFVVKLDKYLKDDRNIEKLIKYIEKVIFARVRQEYMEVIIALGDYFLRGLDDYEYDPIEPYYMNPIWTRDQIVERRRHFLEAHFSKHYRGSPVDYHKVYEAYMLREERFGCIVFAHDGAMLVIKPKGINKIAFPKACRKIYKYTEGEHPETEQEAAIRCTSEKTSIDEDKLLPYITNYTITVQPYLWTIKFFVVAHPLTSHNHALHIGAIRNITDVDYALWDDSILDYEGGCVPVKDLSPRMPYVRAMDRALDTIISNSHPCAAVANATVDTFPTEVFVIPNKRKKKGSKVKILVNITILPWILVILTLVINKVMHANGYKPDSNPYWRDPEEVFQTCPY